MVAGLDWEPGGKGFFTARQKAFQMLALDVFRSLKLTIDMVALEGCFETQVST